MLTVQCQPHTTQNTDDVVIHVIALPFPSSLPAFRDKLKTWFAYSQMLDNLFKHFRKLT